MMPRTCPGSRSVRTTDRDDTAAPDHLVTYRAAVDQLGLEVADQALEYGRHHHADDGAPYWIREDLDDILGLIAIGAEGGR